MSGVWFLVRQSTPVIVPASCGEYSGAEPSGLRGSLEILRNSVSTRLPGVSCATPSAVGSADSENPASAVAESCMVRRRDIFIARLLVQADSFTTVSALDKGRMVGAPNNGAFA